MREELRAAVEEIRRKDEQIRELRRERNEPIAIVGMGLRFPGGNRDPEQFADFLRNGDSGIRPLPDERRHLAPSPGPDSGPGGQRPVGGFLDALDHFDAAFFNISPKEAVYIDPHQRLTLETAWEALEHAGIDPTTLRHGDTGVFMGVTTLDYIFETVELTAADLDGYLAPGLSHSGVAGRLSYFLGLRGPCLTVDTTCSSSLASAHLAVQALRGKECSVALCGGVNVIHNALNHTILQTGNMLAPDGQCKTFDDSADGYARAEGCGVLVLKRLSDAERDGDTVHAVILGSAVGQDGESAGLAAPNGGAQETVIRTALARTGLTPGDIQYVEAHGTGTALGDPTELGAISDVFGESHSPAAPLTVGSLKTNIGHMEGAAGVGGIIKTVLQLREGTIFPHLNFVNPSRRIAWDQAPVTIPVRSAPWPGTGPRRALVNGFGVTGTIASVVLGEVPAPTAVARQEPGEAQARQEPSGGVFTLTAKSRKSLRALAERYRTLLAENPGLPVADICRATNTGRAHFKFRIAGRVRDHRDLALLLDKHLTLMERGETAPAVAAPKVAFLFTGMGSQYPGMGSALYRRYPVFRDALDACDDLFRPLLGRSLRDLMLDGSDDSGLIDEAGYAQPAVFSLEYALARLWLSWGLRPSVLIGHSLGELTAATVAGLFPLQDAARLVAERGRLSQSASNRGGMAAVGAPAHEVAPLLGAYADLVVGAVNGPTQCLVSGDRDALGRLGEALKAKEVRFTLLRASVPYHSPLLAGVLDDFRAVLASVRFRTPELPLVSNVTGRVAKWAEISTPEYWARHLMEPVRFEDGIRAVERRGRHAFVEIGPTTALISLARNCAERTDHLWVGSTYREDHEADGVLRGLAQLYSAGVPVSWAGHHQGRPRSEVPLPTYAFEHKPYWLPTPQRQAAEAAWKAERTSRDQREADRQLYHEAHWVRQPVPKGDPGQRRVLVLNREAGHYARLAARAADAGLPLAFARPGDDLASALRTELLTDLCWFWRTTPPDAGDTATGVGRLRAECEENYRALLDVLATLGQESFGRNQRLWLVTEGAQLLPGDVPDDSGPASAAATLWGFGRALGVECPGYQVTLLDLQGGVGHDSDANDGHDEQALLGEWLAAREPEFQLAHRGGERWVRRLRTAAPEQPADPRRPVTVRPDRTYVIAGGLGTLGLATARRLVRLGARHLALLGRSGAGQEELSRLGLGDGGDVTVYRCDIGSAEDLERTMAALAAGGPPVGGIVHAAGVVADAAIGDQTWETIDAVFRTKVYGAWLLHRAAAALPELDFFLGYSSASALVGATMQTNSCAGNAFLDHLMARRSGRGMASLSVNWGPWGSDDPQRRLSTSLIKSWENQGIVFLDPEEAMSTLPVLLGGERAQIMVGHCDWERFIGRRPRNALYTDLTTRDDGTSGRTGLDVGSLIAAPERERLTGINTLVRARIADVLQFDDADDLEPDAELPALGLDSLNAVEVRNALEAAFRVTLPASIAFDQPRVDLLADYLDRLLTSPPAAT
ncbi:type I polyketide synthase [Streptomyces bobili]|uniref:type I polyketide synthase n=1 Tax=Streptomyces bobili TaxID=67280 RepID=UPI0033EA2F39